MLACPSITHMHSFLLQLYRLDFASKGTDLPRLGKPLASEAAHGRFHRLSWSTLGHGTADQQVSPTWLMLCCSSAVKVSAAFSNGPCKMERLADCVQRLPWCESSVRGLQLCLPWQGMACH